MKNDKISKKEVNARTRTLPYKHVAVLLAPFFLFSLACRADTITIDLTHPAPSSSGNQFYVVIAARPPLPEKSWFGHAFVALGIEDHINQRSIVDSYGLNLVDTSTTGKIWAGFDRMDGKVSSEALSDSNDVSGITNMTDSIIIKVDRTAFNRAKDYIKSFSKSSAGKATSPPITLQAIQHDCVTFAHDVAREAGLDLPTRNFSTPSTFLPTSYLKAAIQELATAHSLSLKDGAIYTGQIVNGQPHGNGQVTFKNGSTLTAPFKFGQTQGIGVYKANGTTISGMWNDWRIDTNHVTVVGSDGSIFTGTLDSKTYRPDKGTLKLNNGSTFTGKISDGNGTITTDDGTVFKGSMDPKTFSPIQGTLNETDGYVFTGTFENGKMKHGVITTSDHDTYTGDFVGGKPSNGTWSFQGGDSYTGTFQDGKPSNGTWSFHNGDSYTGTLQDEHFVNGRYTFADGSVYVGTFDANSRMANGSYHKSGQPWATTVSNGQGASQAPGTQLPPTTISIGSSDGSTQGSITTGSPSQ